jgi:hypothetical protein
MAYSDFTLEAIVEQQQLTLEETSQLFSDVKPIAPSDWLKETLSVGELNALPAGNEKARSEFIVAPILMQVVPHSPSPLMLFSGKSMDVDPDKGLDGPVDFLVCQGTVSRIIRSPFFSLIQAKKQDIDEGLGPCIAQMVGSQQFNQNKGTPISPIYGCVTTADQWQFLKLTQQTLWIDSHVYYYPNKLNEILGILQFMLDPNRE